MASEVANRSAQALRTPRAPGDGRVYRGLARLVGWALRTISDEEWDDARQLPPTGGVIVVSNHISYLDVLAVGRYLIWSGRWPRYLGKSELWKVPVVSWFARQCNQIPVVRGTRQAKDSLGHARAALEAGECIGIYPEGGRTQDPLLWPQTARTGVGRLALETGVTVVPTANWGTHEVTPSRGLTWPRMWPRKKVRVVMGDPIDLSDLVGRTDVAAAREATERIMTSVTALVEGLRGEQAAPEIWNPQLGRRVARRTAG